MTLKRMDNVGIVVEFLDTARHVRRGGPRCYAHSAR